MNFVLRSPLPCFNIVEDESSSTPFTDVDFTVGWICTCSQELAASVESFDDEYHGLQLDLEAHSYGRLAQHTVVVACLLDGMTGTNAAVRRPILHSITSPRFYLVKGSGKVARHLTPRAPVANNTNPTWKCGGYFTVRG